MGEIFRVSDRDCVRWRDRLLAIAAEAETLGEEDDCKMFYTAAALMEERALHIFHGSDDMDAPAPPPKARN